LEENFELNNRMIELKNKLNIVKKVIPEGTNIYYFDYPVHENIGDMLIWRGTENFFKESKIYVKKRFSYHQVARKLQANQLIKIPQNVTIVCQGGGNFGDLYWSFHNLRKLLVKNYPLNRIVFLPQTIYYENISEMNEDFKLLKNHKDIHIFARDINSFNLVKKDLNNVYLCPDMAHSLYPIFNNTKSNLKTLYFIRQDKEAMDMQCIYLEENSPTFDWQLLYSRFEKVLLKFFVLAHNSSKITRCTPNNLLPKLWSMYTNYIINKAVLLFSENGNIVTSRLHGHILACLMNKNNKLIDNSYGKNFIYYKSWTNSIKNTNLFIEEK
jgi:pyruvyl transferase EpsO